MKRSKVRGLSALLVPGAIVVMATACSSSDPGPDEGTGGMTGATTGGATGSGGMTSGSTGGATGSGGATTGTGGGTSSGGGFQASGGTTSYCETHGDDLTAPFAVQVEDGPGFIPSGYMGDTASITASACSDRAPGAIGTCSGWTFAAEATSWGGVAWIYPYNAWTSTEAQPGLCISDDVTAVTFYAKGAEGGESISFGAAAEGQSTGNVTLETTWTKYTIPVTVFNNHIEGGTQNGFSWVSEKPTEAVTFYIDSIQWITADGGLGGAGPE